MRRLDNSVERPTCTHRGSSKQTSNSYLLFQMHAQRKKHLTSDSLAIRMNQSKADRQQMLCSRHSIGLRQRRLSFNALNSPWFRRLFREAAFGRLLPVAITLWCGQSQFMGLTADAHFFPNEYGWVAEQLFSGVQAVIRWYEQCLQSVWIDDTPIR